MTRPIKTWINGAESDCLSANDRGFQYGDGVFETLAVVSGQPLLWSRHWRRLLAGCRALRFETLPEVEVVERALGNACDGVGRGVLKCIVSRGVGGRGYGGTTSRPTVALTLWPWIDQAANARGIDLYLCRTRLSHSDTLAGVKHLNRLEQVLARREWTDGFAEGLMLDETGAVIEGTMSNVFAVFDGELATPDLARAGVRGIMRECALECASALGISARVSALPLETLMRADEIFVTNSIIGLWPVKHFNNQDFALGEVAQKIGGELRARGYAAPSE